VGEAFPSFSVLQGRPPQRRVARLRRRLVCCCRLSAREREAGTSSITAVHTYSTTRAEGNRDAGKHVIRSARRVQITGGGATHRRATGTRSRHGTGALQCYTGIISTNNRTIHHSCIVANITVRCTQNDNNLCHLVEMFIMHWNRVCILQVLCNFAVLSTCFILLFVKK